MKPSILVVDDELSIREAISAMLEDDYIVVCAKDGKEALQKIKNTKIDLVLLDILMPDMDGLEVLSKMKELEPAVEVVMVTATKTIETAVKAIKLGAYEYITKPFDKDKILSIINRALEKKELKRENIILHEEIETGLGYKNIVGKSKTIKKILELIEKVRKNDVTILISGESGTGKEIVARTIHQKSIRADKPFVAVNCGAIPPDLVEGELFGHEKGAFTSAVNRQIGKFEYANEGTLFLDDVSNLPIPNQAKLLRVLQEKEITRIGSNKVIPIDVRVIASTNINLEKAIEEKTFREDLYYRLRVIPIYVPPLKERKEDIPLLFEYFLDETNKRFHKMVKIANNDVLEILKNYSWPGNVRELKNTVEMLVVLSEKEKITFEDLPVNILMNQCDLSGFEGIPLKKALEQFETQFLLKILEKVKWNQSDAAKLMGIHRNTLILKMKELKISKKASSN